jgi:predicted dehydrogenase
MTFKKVRWGIFGAGNIAQRFAEDIQHSRTGTLVAVGARSLEKAEQFADRFKGVRAFDDFDALARWTEVDAIYVATPNTLHSSHSLIAIGAGKAVLCEKPFATSAQEAKEVVSAAVENNVFCMEAMWTRFLPAVAALREKIDRNGLGKIVHLEISLGFSRPEVLGDPITDPALGGGVVLDLGVYGLSMAEDLLGPYQLLNSEVEWSEAGASRTALMVLRHERNGAVSVISVSHETQLANTLVLSGTDARATLDAPFIQARRVHFAQVNSAKPDSSSSKFRSWIFGSIFGTGARLGAKLLHSLRKQTVNGSFRGGGLQFEIDEVGYCHAEGSTFSQRMPLTTSVYVLEVLDEVRK